MSSHLFVDVIPSANADAALAMKLLQKLRERTERLKSSSGADKKVNEIQIRENCVNTTTRKYVDVMKEYQSSQSKFKTVLKKQIRRQLLIANIEEAAEEILKVRWF